MVGADSELANLQEASIWDMVDKYQFIPTNESTDTGSAIHEIYQQFAQSSHLDFQPQENTNGHRPGGERGWASPSCLGWPCWT